MSKNKNNRPKEIRSLKGPKRKLILEVHDGKRYIKKRDLQHYFFEEKWKIQDFRYHFGLGHRVVRQSLYKWFTKEEIDQSHRDKIADKQKGDRNSNSVNWYRPSKLIPLENLLDAIRNSKSKRELKEKLNLTSYELSFLQQFYNLRLPKKDILVDDFSVNHLSKSEILLLAKFSVMSGTFEDLLSGNTRRIHNGVCKLIELNFELKYLLRKLKKYFRDISWNMPTNLIEYHFYKRLIRMFPDLIPQYFFRDLNIHVDFMIPSRKLIIELDGMFHIHGTDQERDKKLNSKGYTVVRINLDKENLSRFVTSKDIRICLKKYLSKVLNQ